MEGGLISGDVHLHDAETSDWGSLSDEASLNLPMVYTLKLSVPF